MKKLIAVFTLAALAFSSNATAQESVTKIQSLYIYNFVKNIQWQNVNDKYILGVYASDAVLNEIKAVLGPRKFNGKPFEIKRISSPRQASNCHIVYVSSSYAPTVKELKENANLRNTLVVSEKGQLNNGASIAFILENSKLKFKINEAACSASGLQVSASLLSLGV